MTLIPFPSTRFTKQDVGAIVELCCQLMLLGGAGGWARHTSSTGADVLRILDPDDEEEALYTFRRGERGIYQVYDWTDELIAEGESLPELLTHWRLEGHQPPIAANMNRP